MNTKMKVTFNTETREMIIDTNGITLKELALITEHFEDDWKIVFREKELKTYLCSCKCKCCNPYKYPYGSNTGTIPYNTPYNPYSGTITTLCNQVTTTGTTNVSRQAYESALASSKLFNS
jgi:hypothetical protein